MTQLIAGLFLPLSLFFVAMLVAFLLRKSKKKTAYRIGISSVILLYIASLPLLSSYLQNRIDIRHHYPQSISDSTFSAIVILGGYTSQISTSRGQKVQALTGIDRLFSGINLWFEGWAPVVILTGGTRYPDTETPESERIKSHVLRYWNIPEDVILSEPKSMTTRENALFTAALMEDEGMPLSVVLVTSATHMRRAVFAFEQAGFEVYPYATDYSNFSTGFPAGFLPSVSALHFTSGVFKERLGFWYYRLTM